MYVSQWLKMNLNEYIANRVIDYLKENDDARNELNNQNKKLKECGIMLCEICRDYCDEYEKQKEYCKKCYTRMCNKCYVVCHDCGDAYCPESCIQHSSCDDCLNILCDDCFDKGPGLCRECEDFRANRVI